MSRTSCWHCGAEKIEGRLNCRHCGRVYRDASRRRLERDPQRQGKQRVEVQ